MSLDHSVWFHWLSDTRGWLLFAVDAGVFNQAGGLLVSIRQESLLRPMANNYNLNRSVPLHSESSPHDMLNTNGYVRSPKLGMARFFWRVLSLLKRRYRFILLGVAVKSLWDQCPL
ncbi:MAG: hypothetical protein ACJAYW_000907 [Candidatus Azotimanducaceae bacterium]|jgi:hypothetical protein